MCGIAGVLRLHDPAFGEPPPPLEAIPESWLDILDESIKHRGPDGQGRFRDRVVRDDGTVVDVALVHRRLSILDHAGGHQPMAHDGQRLRPDLTYQPGEEPRIAGEAAPGVPLVAVVFNGCIYNHRALRAELEAEGHRFQTDHADTEVLIHGWREWGLPMQDELDGMYAALIWDRGTGQLAAASDISGEKPLSETCGMVDAATRVYASANPGLMRALGRLEPEEAQVCVPGIEYWIRFGADHIPATPSCNSSPRCWTICPPLPSQDAGPPPRSHPVRKAGRSARRNRHLPERGADGPALRTLDEAHSLIVAAVTSRLEADVPLGLFLSGGLDSGLIAAIAARHRSDIGAYTVRMPEKRTVRSGGGRRFDESEAAAESAAHLGLTHRVLDCEFATRDAPARDLVHLIHQLGLPFGDSSLLPTYWVCRAAREHVKVALSGDGGDELFGGYRRHTINTALNRWRRPLGLIPDRLLDRRRPGSRWSYLARLGVAARHGGYPELLAIFPTPDLRRLVPGLDAEPTGEDRFLPIDDPLRYDFTHYLPDDLLRKTDTASMAVALEVRAPFLARELVDAALRTPLDVLMPRSRRGPERKGLLKRVARRYLPDHVVDRPKQGFAIPIGDWFRSDFGGMRQLLYDHLESAEPFPGLADAGVEIDTGFVRRMLREHDAAGERSFNPWHGRDHAQRLHMLLALSIWAKWLEGGRGCAGARA